MTSTAQAAAPGSVANCAVGFDLLGHSLALPARDVATVTRTDSGTVQVTEIRGIDKPLPLDAEHNTAGRALQAMLAHAPGGTGFDVSIDKGIPLSSGMGGSAASAVAAVLAANELLEQKLTTEALYQAACHGEAAASGAAHGDNVAPSLLGGLVIAPRSGAPVALPVPNWLHTALIHPHVELETRRSRAVLEAPFALASFVQQSEGLALVLAGCYTDDPELLRRGLVDVLVEPRRAPLVVGFDDVQRAARDCGALGASIAGGGPSMFAWFASRQDAERGLAAMSDACRRHGFDCDAVVAPVGGPPAEVLS